MSLGNKNTNGDKLSRMRWQLAMLKKKKNCCTPAHLEQSSPPQPQPQS